MFYTYICYWSIFQYKYIVSAKFGIPNLSQSPDIGENSDGDISDFWISGQSCIKENCHNSRTSNDTDMKLEPLTKLDKRNTTTSEIFDVSSANCDILSFFWLMADLEQSESRILDTWSLILKFLWITTFYPTKTENRSKISLTQLSYYCFE